MFEFSDHERMILFILGRKKKMTIQEISNIFYHSQQKVPLAKRNYVAGIIRRIEAKCEKKKFKWTLLGEGSGRGGRIIWRGKRGRTKKRIRRH